MTNIRTSRKSGFLLRGGSMRRETEWGELSTVEASLTGAPTAVLASSLSAAALALRPFTIVRVRGIMHIRSDQIAASETYGGDLGMAVVSDQAVAIGVTAVPTPLTDKASDLFFVYEQLFSRFQVGSGAGTGVPQDSGVWKPFDSKAMRKVNGDQDVIVSLENEIAGTVLTFSGRFLIKLH